MLALENRVLYLAAAEMEDISAPGKTRLILVMENLPLTATGMTVLLLTMRWVPLALLLLVLAATDKDTGRGTALCGHSNRFKE